MKLIIAGGRDYPPSEQDVEYVTNLVEKEGVTEIVSGGARGADAFGESMAVDLDLDLKIFPADWDNNGKAAGFVRNAEMANYADAVLLFPGGRGTAHMRKMAENRFLRIFERYENDF